MNNKTGFVRACGKKLIDGQGHEFLLRGVGFGNWLLPEGYMWCFPEAGDRPRRIEHLFEYLIGKDDSALFWESYYENYISEADIRQIAAEGFNSVRIPINSRFLLKRNTKADIFNKRHLEYVDRVIKWCGAHGLYAILDLHGAPGGQTGTNIDDSELNHPDLFTDEKNVQLTIKLWELLADRYKDEQAVAGYDLLNEPLPEWFSQYNSRVMPLYRDIIKAIRRVDRNHMIILEGVHWATDWSVFDENPDGNLMLQFHKYWNNPDTESIQAYLDKREEWNVPIFMGEGGENNTDWYAGAFRLFEDHDISWNFWTWKKMDTSNSPCSIVKPAKWELLMQCLEGGERPDKKTAKSILWEYLKNISFKNCIYRPEVVNAIFRRPGARIPAVFYGYKGKNISFCHSNGKKTELDFRAKDFSRMAFCEDTNGKINFQHGRGEPWKSEEWLCLQMAEEDWYVYEFNAVKKARVSPVINISVPVGEATFMVRFNDSEAERVSVNGSEWKDLHLNSVAEVEPGLNRVVLKAEKGMFCIKWLTVNTI